MGVFVYHFSELLRRLCYSLSVIAVHHKDEALDSTAHLPSQHKCTEKSQLQQHSHIVGVLVRAPLKHHVNGLKQECVHYISS